MSSALCVSVAGGNVIVDVALLLCGHIAEAVDIHVTINEIKLLRLTLKTGSMFLGSKVFYRLA